MKLGLAIVATLIAGNVFAMNTSQVVAQNYKCKIIVDTVNNMMSIYDLKNNFIIKGSAVSMNDTTFRKMITKPYKSDMIYSLNYIGFGGFYNNFTLETRDSIGKPNLAKCETNLI